MNENKLNGIIRESLKSVLKEDVTPYQYWSSLQLAARKILDRLDILMDGENPEALKVASDDIEKYINVLNTLWPTVKKAYVES